MGEGEDEVSLFEVEDWDGFFTVMVLAIYKGVDELKKHKGVQER